MLKIRTTLDRSRENGITLGPEMFGVGDFWLETRVILIRMMQKKKIFFYKKNLIFNKFFFPIILKKFFNFLTNKKKKNFGTIKIFFKNFYFLIFVMKIQKKKFQIFF